MERYKSAEKIILHSAAEVFGWISDLNKLDFFKEKIEEIQGVKNFAIGDQTLSFDTDFVGKVSLALAEVRPYSAVAYTVKTALKDADIQIDLKGLAENETAMTLSLKADMPVFLKMMLGNKLSEGIEKMADKLAAALNAIRSNEQ